MRIVHSVWVIFYKKNRIQYRPLYLNLFIAHLTVDITKLFTKRRESKGEINSTVFNIEQIVLNNI